MNRSIPIVAACLMLTGCSEKDARDYAAKLSNLLASYSRQLDARMSGEVKRYRAEALDFETARDTDVESNLQMDRTAAAIAMIRELESGRLTSGKLLDTVLPEYAEKDFAETRRIYQRSDDAYLEHIKNLQDLTVETAKVRALENALAALAKEKSLLEWGGDLNAYRTQVQALLSFQACADDSAQIKTLEAAEAALTAQLAALPEAETEKRQKLTRSIEETQAGLKALRAHREGTGRFEGGECKAP